MTRKSWMLAAAAGLVVALVAGAVAVLSGAKQSASAAQDAPPDTAKVQKGKLSDAVSLKGTLTYRARPDGSPYTAINQASGTYTELPDEGDKVGCGDVFYRVDDKPVLLLCGTTPAYRDLYAGDKGSDVRALNRNLHIPGDRFTAETSARLAALRRARGLDATGSLALGDAVFLPASARIAKVSGRLGGAAQPGGQVALATSDSLEVQVQLDASQQGQVKKGDRAQISLPGNESVTGRVRRLGRIARTAGNDGDVAGATIPVYIGLDNPGKARGLDRAPVRAQITTAGVKSALSVPVTAIIGKSGDGFAVEVVRGDGRRELVAVELGLFDTADGRVQVDGDLRAGDQVVVPSL